MSGAMPRVENGVVLVRTAHCFACGDVETGVDLRCPRCGELCPSASAGRPRVKDVVVNGEGAGGAKPATADGSGAARTAGTSLRIVMPGTTGARQWRAETERLLASQEARRKEIRQIFAPLQAEDEQLAASIKALRQLLAQVEVGEAVGPVALVSGKRWSRKFDRCQDPECRTPERAHGSKGLCEACYARQMSARRRGE